MKKVFPPTEDFCPVEVREMVGAIAALPDDASWTKLEGMEMVIDWLKLIACAVEALDAPVAQVLEAVEEIEQRADGHLRSEDLVALERVRAAARAVADRRMRRTPRLAVGGSHRRAG